MYRNGRIRFAIAAALFEIPNLSPRTIMHKFRTVVLLILTLGVVGIATRVHAEADESGFKTLFNGKNLDGWEGEAEVWRVENGLIVGESTEAKPLNHNSFLRWGLGEVDDFELRLEFKLTGSNEATANSGVQYRSGIKPDGHVFGYQADIDMAGNWLGACYDELGRGMLAKRGESVVIGADGKRAVTELGNAAELQKTIKKGDWNEYTIICRGNHLQQKLNGQLTVDITDGQISERDLQGVLALQMHSGPAQRVEFRNLRMKRTKLEARAFLERLLGKGRDGHS